LGDVIHKLFSEGLIYLLIFLILFFLTVIESIHEFNKYSKVTSIISIVFLILFTSFRWNTGTDWKSYNDLFQDVDVNFGELFFIQLYSFDFGYVFLNILVKYFTSSYTVLLIVDSCIALGLVFLFIKKYSPNPNLSIFVFYNAFFVAQFMGSNRRIIAMGLSLFAISSFIYKSNFWFFQTASFFFHKSSIVAFISKFVPKERFSIYKIAIILIVSLLVGVFQIPFKILELISGTLTSYSGFSVIDKLSVYTIESEDIVLGNRDPVLMMFLSIVKRCVFLIFYLIIIYKRNGKLDLITNFFLNIYIVGFSLYLLLNGSEVIQVSSSYFTFIEIVLIGRFWNYAYKRDKLIFLPVLFIYGFFQLVSSLTAFPELYIPYKSFFN
jgi:hypothetical protein